MLPRSSRLALAALVAALALAGRPATARCIDEERPDGDPAGAAPPPAAPADPRSTLQTLVGEALQRSHAVGASQLLAEASLADLEEARAAKQLQASVSGGLGPTGGKAAQVDQTSALQVRANVNLSKLLWDGGRSDRFSDWRQQLAESTRLGHLSAREQLALTTVTLALERARYRHQVQIYAQYVSKMGCMVEALEAVSRSDRGRASELVQVRKALQQAELSQTAAQSSSRQTDIRLRRLVGDGLPGVEGLSAALLVVPDLEALVAEVEHAAEVEQITAEAQAAREYARAVAAGDKPQLSLAFSGGGATGVGGNQANARSSNYALGLQLSIPLLSPGLAPSSNAARLRAQAAELQRADAIESRRFRAAELHEQVLASFDRMRRLGLVLRDSEQLRTATLQQWQQLGRRSLFDVMAAEGDHYSLRVSYVNALYDAQELNANLISLGRGVGEWLR
jgi:outer membrane protein TolC